jgi:hypothetical protein
MMVYDQHLRPTMSALELFRVFALSNEFKLLPVSFFFVYLTNGHATSSTHLNTSKRRQQQQQQQ